MTPAQAPPAPAGRRAGVLRHGAVELHPRRNGLNLVRLVLAYSVLVAHGWYIAGDGIGPSIAGENIGGWAVFGFFAISGYLITGSRLSKPLSDYLLHRIARIYPAFLVCLVVTAGVIAPVGYLVAHGSVDGLLTTPTTPINYVLSNVTLRMNAYDVAGTPAGVPYVGAWDGSLWSLYYEFLCYVIVAVLACIGLVRRSPVGLGVAWALSVLAHLAMPRLAPYTQGNPDLVLLAKLLPFFLAGGLLYMVRERLVLSWPGVLLACGVTVASVAWLGGTGPQVASLAIAYAVLWVGAVLPCPELLRRNDISYGIYIYAFPVQQLLALAGAHAWNLAVFDVVAALATIPLAVASWLLVERPVMRAARRATSHRTEPARTARVEQPEPARVTAPS